MGELELAGIAGRLYALPIEDFVAARTAAARELAAGGAATGSARAVQRSLAAEVRALPKPSVAAWTVNLLAAREPETLHELVALGRSMRSAQLALDAAELRRLAQQRRLLLSRALGQARTVAEQQGRKISDATIAEVEGTLRAATADEGAAAAVQSGRLLRGLSADGVDVVELRNAVALPSLAAPASPSPASSKAHSRGLPRATESGEKQTEEPRLRAVRQGPRTPPPSALERARNGLRDAEQSAHQAAEEAGRGEEESAAARKLAADLDEAARTLRARLEQTESDLKAARQRYELAAARAQQAVRAADKARRKEDLARERVLRLDNTPG